MNKKQKLAIIILSIFIIGMCIGAADAAHTVKKGKTKVKITNKEYKKLTATKTAYKNVTKTRNVTKYKQVTKTRKVNKTEIERKDNVKTGCVIKKNGEVVDIIPLNETQGGGIYPNYEQQGYTRNSSVIKDLFTSSQYSRGGNYKNGTPFYYHAEEYTNFTKTTYYTVDENYTADEPYTVTEKYQVKVPYKVRKDATVTKKVPKKYKTVKEAYYVWKKVKSYYTVSEWKYVGKSEIFGLQTPAMKKDTARRVKKIRAAGWKINKDEHRSKYDMVDGGIYRHYYLCTKKVYYTEKKKVKKYKKVKKQVKMRIKSWAQNAAPKGKVWVTLYYGDQLKKGKCISQGYAKIK